MSDVGARRLQVYCIHPIENRDISPVVLLTHRSHRLSGWQLSKAQRDFIVNFLQ